MCTVLPKHPMKGGYEFPLGCKERVRGKAAGSAGSVGSVGKGVGGDSLRNCRRYLTPLTP